MIVLLEDEKVLEIIEDVTNKTISNLRKKGIIKDHKRTAYKKTEYVLKNYNKFKKSIENNPQNSLKTERIIKCIDEALKSIDQDPYISIIEMKFFENKTREEIAEFFNVEPKTITRNKKRLINKIKVMIFSDDTINELFFD